MQFLLKASRESRGKKKLRHILILTCRALAIAALVTAIARPLGDRDDPDARIFPFKLHEGRLPVVKDTRWILPIAVEEFFVDGELEKAIREGAESAYGLHDAEWDWVDTRRWMSINHEVMPVDRALGCLERQADLPLLRQDRKRGRHGLR